MLRLILIIDDLLKIEGVKMKITKIKKVIGLSLLFLFGLLIWDLWILPKKSDLFFELWTEDVQHKFHQTVAKFARHRSLHKADKT